MASSLTPELPISSHFSRLKKIAYYVLMPGSVSIIMFLVLALKFSIFTVFLIKAEGFFYPDELFTLFILIGLFTFIIYPVCYGVITICTRGIKHRHPYEFINFIFIPIAPFIFKPACIYVFMPLLFPVNYLSNQNFFIQCKNAAKPYEDGLLAVCASERIDQTHVFITYNTSSNPEAGVSIDARTHTIRMLGDYYFTIADN